MALKKRLRTDASLRPILAQYVPLELDTQSADWQTWSRRFKHEGRAIPIIFVVRADGKVLYGKSGSMEGGELLRFLATMRKQTGLSLSLKQAKSLADAVKQGNKAFEQGDTATAVKAIAKLPKSASYAEAVVQARELAAKVIDGAQGDLKQAEQQLDSTDQQLQGALVLARVQRVFRPLPNVAKAARLLRAKHLRDKREILTQAEQLDSAKKFEEQKSLEKALRAYQLVAQRYADTPAAKLAAESIERLQAAGVKVEEPAGETAKPKPKTVNDADVRKAKSYLRFARTFLSKRPDKAKEYLRKVIAVAPGSPEAQQAERLLKQLD